MVGRAKEARELNDLYNSGKAELVVVYGRRRVGKTYLIDEVFNNRITFRHAGLSPIEAKENSSFYGDQLEKFYYSLVFSGMNKSNKPKNWLEAFFMLESYLRKIDDGKRQLIFLDELPWLDTPRSNFITAFEGFWNNYCCHRKNVMVVVCGSSTSWILDKLINNHGGLYGRVTYEIKLAPFSLKECEDFFVDQGVKLSRYDVVQSYMMFGGIPFYMGYFRKDLSLAQNVDEIFFSGEAKLRDEYDRLFSSVFSNPETMKKIIGFLNTRNAGYSRAEISDYTGIKDGGTLTEYLKALLASDFIIKYVPFGLKKKDVHYKLVDSFCLFYLKFVEGKSSLDKDFWQNNTSKQSVISWRGYAFENVCFNHIMQIKEALGIRGVSSSQSAWSKREDDTEGMQIDLLIDREDNTINMCELKFYNRKFSVNAVYQQILMNREALLSQKISKRKRIHNTLITTYGLEYGEYSGVFTNIVTMEDLFRF